MSIRTLWALGSQLFGISFLCLFMGTNAEGQTNYLYWFLSLSFTLLPCLLWMPTRLVPRSLGRTLERFGYYILGVAVFAFSGRHWIIIPDREVSIWSDTQWREGSAIKEDA